MQPDHVISHGGKKFIVQAPADKIVFFFHAMVFQVLFATTVYYIFFYFIQRLFRGMTPTTFTDWMGGD